MPAAVFVDELMHKGELTVPMLTTDAVWFGVTYKEDKPFVQAELRKLHESRVYPARFTNNRRTGKIPCGHRKGIAWDFWF